MKKVLALFVVIALCAMTLLPTLGYGQKSNENSNPRSDQAELRARNYLARRGVNAGQLKAKDIISDETGNHVRFSQFVDGVRVYGRELISPEKTSGKFDQATGELFGGNAHTGSEPRQG